MFDIRNIAFSYRKKSVLRDISFIVSPGETVCLCGDNGAGKTTLLRVLATLLRPDSGQMLLDGKDALARPISYCHQLGYLPEKPALYDDMTVKNFLNYRAALKGEPAKRIRRRVGEALDMCQISRLATQRIATLSLGQKKRVALADAVLLRPRVLLLDDFLAGLDQNMREASGEILSSVAAFSSVIVTGHELDDLAKWATRFLILRDGVIASTISAAGVDHTTLTSRVKEALKGGF